MGCGRVRAMGHALPASRRRRQRSAVLVTPTYSPADDAYLAKRRLRRHARVLHLWAMGVGAVTSGDFFGWNFGLAAGGFGGMLAAVVAITPVCIRRRYSITDMSPVLTH